MGTWLIIALVVVLSIFTAAKWGRQTPKQYDARKCEGKSWKTSFPAVQKEKIRLFLECFVDGMGFKSTDRLKFNPNDKVLDVYRAIYGGTIPFADVMECETFLGSLEAEFGVNNASLSEAYNEDITLGKLFEYVIAQQDPSMDAKSAVLHLRQ